MKRVLVLLLMFCLCLALSAGPAAAQDKEVTIGYQLMFNPWKVAIAQKKFEEATGWTIDWRRFDSGGKLLPALASGDVAIGISGSTGVTTAMSKDLGVELFWIGEGIESAEAMVVRDGSGIVAPQDLRGKTIGVPFVSTTHFHTLFALEQFGIDPSEVNILNMQPNAIAAAWERGDIDATFVWDPALSRVLKTGRVLLTSGLLGSWGKPTFDGIMVNKEFAAATPEFMVAFVKVLAATDASYRDNPEAWTPDSPMVQAIAELTGGNAEDVPGVLAMYAFPSLEEQASCAWLGCGQDGGAARALTATAEFLKAEKKIDVIKPDYSLFINPTWVEKAMQ